MDTRAGSTMDTDESATSGKAPKRSTRMRGLGRVYQPTYRDRKAGKLKTAATWWVQFNHRGKTIREPSHSTNRAVAVKLLKKRLGEIGAGGFSGVDQEKVTFGQLAELVQANYRINGRRSLPRLKSAIANLRRYFGEARAVEIPDRIEQYKAARLDERASRATINRELAALKRMFKLARKQVKVILEIEMLPENNVRKGFFEYKQFRAVVDQLPEDLKPGIEAAYETGWRIQSELLTRKRYHVDLQGKTLRLDPGETKNGEGRTFPLTPRLYAILSRQIARTEAFQRDTGRIVPWVFHRKGKPIKSFRRAWLTACKKAGVPERIPHDFRRTAVRNLERAGVPRSIAMQMVGHKTESIYRRYAIGDEVMLQEAAKDLARFQAENEHAATPDDSQETSTPARKK